MTPGLSAASLVAEPPRTERAVERTSPGETSPACRYCGAADFTPLYSGVRDRLAFAPGTWAFERCAACGSAHLAPWPTDAELATYYPPVYSFATDRGGELGPRAWLNRLEHSLFFGPIYRAQARRVQRHTPGLSRGRLLDVGCGRGLRLLAFRALGFDVQGLDFQPAVVDYLQSRHGIPAVCAGVDELGAAFAPASFDLVTAFYVLEHVTDIARLLEDCRRVLRPGGWFVAAVPLLDSPQARWLGRRWSQVTEAPRHVTLPTQRGLRQACLRAGYSDESIRIVPDSLLSIAGVIGLSLFPGGAATAAYGGGRLAAWMARFGAAATVALASPWVAFENYCLRRPGLGIVVGQTPK